MKSQEPPSTPCPEAAGSWRTGTWSATFWEAVSGKQLEKGDKNNTKIIASHLESLKPGGRVRDNEYLQGCHFSDLFVYKPKLNTILT